MEGVICGFSVVSLVADKNRMWHFVVLKKVKCRREEFRHVCNIAFINIGQSSRKQSNLSV